MAGIGFALKKIYRKNTITAQLEGAFYSVFSTIGHVLIIIGALAAVKLVLSDAFASMYHENLYSEIIVYSFIFPLIFTSGINIVLSRYIADCMWQTKNGDIGASLTGVLPLYTCLASIPAFILLSFASDMPFILKLFSYLLYMQMGIIFILMVYVSAVKDYVHITISFVIGMGLIILLVLLTKDFLRQSGHMVTWLIIYFVIGTAVTAGGIFRAVYKTFPENSGKYFDFLRYIRKYPKLFLANTVYTLSMYAQNFIFWLYPDTGDKVSAFRFSGEFDLATAFAVYTILPAAVIFVVRTEVYFYESYREYIEAVNVKTGVQIKKAKLHMQRKLWEELLFCFEIQGLLSMILMVAGMLVLPYIGVPTMTLDVFPYLVFGIYLLYFTFLCCTLMQYFENYDDSLKVFMLSLFLNVLFTGLFIYMGADFYGLGIAFASLASLIYAVWKLKGTLEKTDVAIFCSGTLRPKEQDNLTEKIADLLNDGKE